MAVMKVLDTVTIKGSAESVYNEFLKYVAEYKELSYLDITLTYKTLEPVKENIIGFYKNAFVGKVSLASKFNDLAGFERVTGKKLDIKLVLKNKNFEDDIDKVLNSKEFTYIGKIKEKNTYTSNSYDEDTTNLVCEYTTKVNVNGKNEYVTFTKDIMEDLKNSQNSVFAKIEFARLKETINKEDLTVYTGTPTFHDPEYDSYSDTLWFYLSNVSMLYYLESEKQYYLKITMYSLK